MSKRTIEERSGGEVVNSPTTIGEARDMLRARFPNRSTSVEHRLCNQPSGVQTESTLINVHSVYGHSVSQQVYGATFAAAWAKLTDAPTECECCNGTGKHAT